MQWQPIPIMDLKFRDGLDAVRGGLHRLSTAGAVLILAGISVTAADDWVDGRTAQSRSVAGEAVLGTFHLKGRDIGDEAPIVDRSPVEGTPQRSMPIELFADAQAALDGDDRQTAQRLFEQVVAVAPDSRLAAEARVQLGRLYRQPASQHARQQAATSQLQSRQAGIEPGSSDAQARIAPPRTGHGIYGPQKREDLELRRQQRRLARELAMLERQFIAEVGDRVFFAKGSAGLGTRARDVLKSQARWLNAHPFLSASLGGHADDGPQSGRELEKLSLTRANAVKDRLIEEGVAASRLHIVSYGNADPIAQCDGVGCAAQNRRVVTTITRRLEPVDKVAGAGQQDVPLGAGTTEKSAATTSAHSDTAPLLSSGETVGSTPLTVR